MEGYVANGGAAVIEHGDESHNGCVHLSQHIRGAAAAQGLRRQAWAEFPQQVHHGELVAAFHRCNDRQGKT